MLIEPAAPPTSRPLGEYFKCDLKLVEAAVTEQHEAQGHRKRLGESLLDDDAITLEALYEALRQQRVDRLGACRLFTSLDDAELAKTSDIFTEVSFKSGEVFICEDDTDTSMYVLSSGRCEVYRGRPGAREISLAHILPGEPIGELGYFAGGKRTASVRAVDDCQLLRARYDDLSALFERNGTVAAAFMAIVTERLRDTNLLYQRNEFELETNSLVPAGPAAALRRASRADQLKNGIDRLMRRLVRTASRVADAEQATLYAVDEVRQVLILLSSVGGTPRDARQPIGSDVRGWVVKNNRIANVAAAAHDDDAAPQEATDVTVDGVHLGDLIGGPPALPAGSAKSVVCVPVRGAAGRLVGLLEVTNKRIGAFGEADEMILRSLAAQASICIDNIETFRAVSSDFERATDLLEISTVIMQAADTQQVMMWLQPTLRRALGCECAEVLLLGARDPVLWTYEQTPQGDQTLDDSFTAEPALDVTRRVYRRATTLSAEVLETGAAARWVNAYEDDRFDPSFDAATGLRTSSLLAVPLMDRDGIIVGVIHALNAHRGAFTARDEATLVQVAELLALSKVMAGPIGGPDAT